MASRGPNTSIGPFLKAVCAPLESASDRQLLEQFLTLRDEPAFTVLFRRHGPMVLGVCRRILGHTDDAEDAFQAVFLVLAQKAPSLTTRPVLGDWLHGVARITALNARRAAARRRTKERQAARPEALVEDSRPDHLAALDVELGRLPNKYRLPLVLCDLEGKTRREVAEQLRWPEGTVAGRLVRARELLAKRLGQGALASIAAAGLAVPPALASATIRAAILIVGSGLTDVALPGAAVTLARGVMQTMLWNKLKFGAAVLVVLTVLTGVGGWTLSVLAGDKPNTKPAVKPLPQAGQPSAPKSDEPTTASGFYERGLVHQDNKRFDAALADFSQAVALDPTFTPAYWSRSSVYSSRMPLESRDYGKAVADLTTLLQIQPRDCAARYNRAMHYEQLKEYDKSLADYSRVIEGDTDFSRIINKDETLALAHYYRGQVYHRGKKDYAKAVTDYSNALKIDPKIVECVQYDRGMAYAALKEYAKADADFADALKRAPDAPGALAKWAWLLATCPDAKFRDGKKAVDMAAKANAKWGQSWWVKDTLSAAYAEAGNFAEAVGCQLKALDLLDAKEQEQRPAMEQRLALYRAGKPFRSE